MMFKHHAGQNMSGKYDSFENRYQVKKTIRMGLKPQGKTLENIKSKGLLEKDEDRAKDYQELKKIIDRYHREYIDDQLTGKKLTGVDECYNLYSKKNRTKEQNKDLNKKLKMLREQVHDVFKSSPKYKRMTKKEFINEDLLDYVKNPDEKKLVESFKGYKTYLDSFLEKRKFMYSEEGKHGTIAYRTIDQNMLRYFYNIKLIEKFVSEDKSDASLIEKTYSSELGGKTLEEYFSADNYSAFITQSGIDNYNKIIGGYSKGKSKVKGINEYINAFNQAHKAKLGILRFLYKQILSEKTSASFLPKEFKTDDEVIDSLNDFSKSMTGTIADIRRIFSNIAKYDQNGIYLNHDSIGDVSKRVFGDWGAIKDAMSEDYDNTYTGEKKKGNKGYYNERDKHFKNLKRVSVEEINKATKGLGKDVLEEYSKVIVELIDKINDVEKELRDLFSLPKCRDLVRDDVTVRHIKAYLDSVKDLQRHMKPLLGNEDEADRDAVFYGDFLKCGDELDAITPIYDKVRNYMTKKPYSTEKLKLKFDKSTMMAGWSVTKERDNLAVIMMREGEYYLGIMDKEYNDIFENLKGAKSGADCYQKMRYMELADPNRDLPHTAFSKEHKKIFNPSTDILKIRSKESYKEGKNFNIDDCHTLIDFYKEGIKKHPVWKEYDFKFSDTKDYRNFSEFCQEVKHQAYKISFVDIPSKIIDDYVDEGKLYLFQISSKDFSSDSKGSPNLQTLYWNMLFDSENLKNVIYKLDGNAEFFYRKASISPSDMIVHPANQPIKNKNPYNLKKFSSFNYNLTKDKRYTEDKFELHVPITLNFKADKTKDINSDVREFIKHSDDLHIIGIDRGERNLLYISVIDKDGNIVEQYSLNEIINEYKGITHRTNYHELLDEREKERAKARQEWTAIQNIKGLKEGYLSQVVHKLCVLMMKYEAIIVLEDLNPKFMSSRRKVEKQIYQKFERMLIEKQNYLVDKKADPSDPTGLLHALQLSNKFESFEKIYKEKQSGFIFYVPAGYTSKIDPCTGFVNLFPSDDLRYSSVKKSEEFWDRFKSISYDDNRDMFAFTFDYDKFTSKTGNSQKEWTVYSYGERMETYKNSTTQKYECQEVKLTDEFKKLFEKFGIDYENCDIKAAILSCGKKDFHKSLLHLFKLTLQLRNSKTGTSIDYMTSPVPNSKGEFFDTRKENQKLPIDADANGAYNIAKKGLLIADRLKNPAEKDKLAIANAEWFKYAQEHVING